jgi:predicted NACHT family NTPase
MFARECSFIKQLGQKRQRIVLQITLKLFKLNGQALSGLSFQNAAEILSRIMSPKIQVLQSGCLAH